MNTNSIKKDIVIVLVAIVAFFGVLTGANYLNGVLGLEQVFNLVDIASITLKVATGSALAWALMKWVFTNTLGKDFGEKFDAGWTAMTPVEKTRWTLGVFLVVFAVIVLA